MTFPCTFDAMGLVFSFARIDKKAGENDALTRVMLASLKE